MVDLTAPGTIPPFPAPTQKPDPSRSWMVFWALVPKLRLLVPLSAMQKRQRWQQPLRQRNSPWLVQRIFGSLQRLSITAISLLITKILQDLRTLPYGEVVLKYGSEVAQNQRRILEAEAEFGATMLDDRSDVELAKDTGVGVAQACGTLVGQSVP